MSEALKIETVPTSEEAMELFLRITDRETCEILGTYAEGGDRKSFAESAIKIGVLSLRHATKQFDVDRIRTECDRFIERLESTFKQRQEKLIGGVSERLDDYFNPNSGHFRNRVRELFGSQGAVTQIFSQLVGTDDSQLSRMLDDHIGESSRLMQLLDPDSADSLAQSLSTRIDALLADQNDRVLNEFSLDNKEGALSRFLSEVANRHGDIHTALRGDLHKFMAEFSLDHEESALSRLVRSVDTAQRKMRAELSLDSNESALARMKREILDWLDSQQKKNDEFQRDVLERITETAARKTEALRSTQHGNDFEESACALLESIAQEHGDVATRSGQFTGAIKGCKVGDCVIELGPDNVAAGSKIVVEAKQRTRFTLKEALSEIERARKNRAASMGLFIFSSKSVPNGIEAFKRYGTDVVIVWDEDDPATDAYLRAGLECCRALCIKERLNRDTTTINFAAVEEAITEIERSAKELGEFEKWTETIYSHSKKMRTKLAAMRTRLRIQAETLSVQVTEIKHFVTEPDDDDFSPGPLGVQ